MSNSAVMPKAGELLSADLSFDRFAVLKYRFNEFLQKLRNILPLSASQARANQPPPHVAYSSNPSPVAAPAAKALPAAPAAPEAAPAAPAAGKAKSIEGFMFEAEKKMDEELDALLDKADNANASSEDMMAVARFYEQIGHYSAAMDWLGQAALKGHVPAMKMLVEQSQSGNVNQKEQAARVLEELEEALFKIASKFYEDGNDEEALKKFQELADIGHAEAQFKAGFMYLRGQGTADGQTDIGNAIKYLTLAADQGYAGAQNELGEMYDKGKGVGVDLSKAIQFYQLAAGQGNRFAQGNLERLNVLSSAEAPVIPTNWDSFAGEALEAKIKELQAELEKGISDFLEKPELKKDEFERLKVLKGDIEGGIRKHNTSDYSDPILQKKFSLNVDLDRIEFALGSKKKTELLLKLKEDIAKRVAIEAVPETTSPLEAPTPPPVRGFGQEGKMTAQEWLNAQQVVPSVRVPTIAPTPVAKPVEVKPAPALAPLPLMDEVSELIQDCDRGSRLGESKGAKFYANDVLKAAKAYSEDESPIHLEALKTVLTEYVGILKSAQRYYSSLDNQEITIKAYDMQMQFIGRILSAIEETTSNDKK